MAILLQMLSHSIIPLFIFMLCMGNPLSFRPRMSYRRRVTALKGLHLETLDFPIQSDPNAYRTLLTEKIPEKDIIRWYIARIQNGFAVIEVVCYPIVAGDDSDNQR
jgi:hypothetical protein